MLEDVAAGVLDADFLHASRRVCHGEDQARNDHAVALLTPFGIRTATLEATGKPHCKFMRFVPDFICHHAHKSANDEVGSMDAS
ncbi:hypothetical protein [Ensifer oleiphilus]|uniref:hypothetical protein n=1 Tax=Ensifer oleiphilus TaxID=2742698 RepID=UPI001FEF9426|nr:hypothetical protein [Ensifer oleiphilus]